MREKIAIHLSNLEEFNRFKNIVRILNQKFDDNVTFKGSESFHYDPNNPYLHFDYTLRPARQSWIKVSKQWLEYQKNIELISLDDFNAEFNPYNDLSIIDKAEEFLKDKEGTEEYLNGLFNGFIDGYIKRQIE